MKCTSILIAAIFVLSACSNSFSPTPTPTAPPTATDTLVPTPTLTPTATEVPLPAFMDEFISLGFDQQSLEADSMYAVYDKGATFYAPDGGILYRSVRIFGWATVHYIENGELRSGLVIVDYCLPTEHQAYYCFYNFGGTIRVSNGHDTVVWVRSITERVYERIPGETFLVKLDLNWQDFKLHNIGLPQSFYDTLFPAFPGRLETFYIPNIGNVIPTTGIFPYGLDD